METNLARMVLALPSRSNDEALWNLNDIAQQYRQSTASADDIHSHLILCSEWFDPPLDSRVDLAVYAEKLFQRSKTFEAWIDGQLRGLVAVYVNSESDQFTAFVSSVSVEREYMGRGIAKILMQCFHRYAREIGVHSIDLEVSANSPNAIGLYKTMGYEAVKQENAIITMTMHFEEQK